MKKDTKQLLINMLITIVSAVLTLSFIIVMLQKAYNGQAPKWITYTTFISYALISAYMVYSLERKSKLRNIIATVVLAFISANLTHLLFIWIGFHTEVYSAETILTWTLINTVNFAVMLYLKKLGAFDKKFG